MFYIFCDAPGNHVHGQQVLVSVGGIVVTHDLLQGVDGKRTDLESGGGSSVQRLFLVIEYLLHLGVDGTADHQVDPAVLLVGVPYVLDVGKDGFTCMGKVLEFIQHQGKIAMLGNAHNRSQQAGKVTERAYIFAKGLPYDLS